MASNMTKLYQVKDRKSMCMVTGILMERLDQAAIRSFGDMCMSEKSMVARHPEDYDLMCVGEQDEEGVIFPCVPPVLVIAGITVVDTLNRAMEQKRSEALRQMQQLALLDEDKQLSQIQENLRLEKGA